MSAGVGVDAELATSAETHNRASHAGFRRNQEPARAHPVIKMVGGKTRLLPELLARMPARFGRYYEPFAGGAALFFRVAPERAVIADSNADLMGMYRALAGDVETVLDLLGRHSRWHSENHYAAVKEGWNGTSYTRYTRAGRAAAFLYLNKTCFNGLWRVNRKGEMNVGWGKHPTFVPDVENLRAAAGALARAAMRTGDYRTTLVDSGRGDFVYLDPPYDGTFGAYTTGGFTDVDQAELAHTVRCLVERGVQVMVSNADTPRIRALYAGMRIDVVQRPGTMSCDGAKRGKVDEVIITAGYGPFLESAKLRKDQR